MVAAGMVPDEVAQVVARTLRLNYSTVHPLLVQGRVAGSISFHAEQVPADATIAAYEAFARQAALTIENAALLRAHRDQLEELKEARRLVTTSNEAVRREIAERLHGPVQTQLVVADFTLRKASSLVEAAPLEARKAIDDARALIDTVREKEIRDVSHILHPWVIGLGLAPAMRSLCDRFRPVMDVHLSIHPDLEGVGAITAVEIDAATRLAAYRIVEEGLANAHKHGHAGSATISLSVSPSEKLAVVVSDDGCGLRSDAQPGLGLRLIAMKVDEVRGTWTIGGNDAGGVLLTALLPLRGGALAGADGRFELSAH
jgi:signal transduction histidine kinase